MTSPRRMTELLAKYSVPGPRYTSYPTVPYWDTSPTEAQWVEHVARAMDGHSHSREGAGAALYVHIPFCESLCTYCGCNTRITRNRAVAAPYLEHVLKEWRLYIARLGMAGGALPHVADLHLGGGTPTFCSPEELRRFLGQLLELMNAPARAQAQHSIEAHPGVTSLEHLDALAEFGFRRLSLGIQDFDPAIQRAVNRQQTVEQVRALTEHARARGFNSINYDLIYGLPHQTSAAIEFTLGEVTRLRPDRIAFYSYAHVPWIKPSQRRYTEADLPGPEAKRALYELGRGLLEAAGYREIGMDHFALQSDALWIAARDGHLHRNFMGYTPERVFPLIGLGVSAIGDTGAAFAQNEKLVETYQRRVDAGELPIQRGHILNDEDRVLREHILNLMTRGETQWTESGARVPHLQRATDLLGEMLRDGLVEISGAECRVLPEGRPFLRNVCMAFDARLARKSPHARIFSQTI